MCLWWLAGAAFPFTKMMPSSSMQAFHGEPLVADPTSDDYFRCARCGRSTRIAATSGPVHLCVASDAGGARFSPKRPVEVAYHQPRRSWPNKREKTKIFIFSSLPTPDQGRMEIAPRGGAAEETNKNNLSLDFGTKD